MTTTSPAAEIPRRPHDGPAPLSFAQELLWLMDRASPGVTAWNVPRALHLRGALDAAALERALDALVARHEALRTVFAVSEQEPRQVVLPPSSVGMKRVDLSALSEPVRRSEVERLTREHALTPFDLSRDLLLRALLIELGGDEYVLCLNSHHIVSDGWSKSIMFRELSALYEGFRRGETVTLPPLPIQFADYAAWERDARHEAALAEPLAYWRERLGGTLPVLALPTDRPRPVAPGFDGARRIRVLPRELVSSLGALARAHDATLYMALLAAYTTLLHRYTAQDDIIVGSPIAGRAQSETESLIGYFANTLVLRTSLEGDPTFGELLERVRETCLGAYDNQDVPFEKLVLELQKGRQLTHAPLFQVVLTMEDTMPAELDFAGVEIEPIHVESGTSKFDLALLVAEQRDGLRLSLWYRTELFAPATIDRMLSHLQTLIESALENPAQRVSELRLLAAAERRALVDGWNDTTAPIGDVPVHALFTTAAQRSPDTIALECGDVRLSHRELDARANRLARHLHARGVHPGACVGLHLDRSADAIVAMLAVLKAGAAYVPIPPDIPTPRLQRQLADVEARVVITTAAHRERLPAEGITPVVLDVESEAIARERADAPEVEVSLDDIAYVLFTSGSTGVPKGVAVSHRNLLHYTRGISSRLELADSAPLRFATVSTLAADLGNTAIFPALASGGTLVVVPADVAMDATRFGEQMAARPVDVLKITPGHLRALLSGPRGAAALPRKWLVLGGEACPWELVEQVRREGSCRVLNHYGPTECTVGCATYLVGESDVSASSTATVPIGRPLPNARLYVVDSHGRPVPVGVPGELWVGGLGVANGYVNRPELTAERFIEDPFSNDPDAYVYRTGDRVRRLATGELEFLGRTDEQLKLRGFRVEPAEITHALAAHPAVATSAVVPHTAPGASEPGLTAYVVPRPVAGYAAAHAERLTPARLTSWLAERLPSYLVPAHVVLLEALPLTPNGKLDRAALPQPAALGAPDEAEATAAPQSETERVLAGLWAEVLKRERVGRTEDFLALGGHSLLAIRVLGRISKQFGVRLPLRTLFEAPTVAQLAPIIEHELRQAKERELEQMLASLEGMSDADVQRMMAEQRERTTT